MALIKLVGKTFAVRQKSAKTVKVFVCVGFVVYGNLFCPLHLHSTLSPAKLCGSCNEL